MREGSEGIMKDCELFLEYFILWLISESLEIGIEGKVMSFAYSNWLRCHSLWNRIISHYALQIMTSKPPTFPIFATAWVKASWKLIHRIVVAMLSNAILVIANKSLNATLDQTLWIQFRFRRKAERRKKTKNMEKYGKQCLKAIKNGWKLKSWRFIPWLCDTLPSCCVKNAIVASALFLFIYNGRKVTIANKSQHKSSDNALVLASDVPVL